MTMKKMKIIITKILKFMNKEEERKKLSKIKRKKLVLIVIL